VNGEGSLKKKKASFPALDVFTTDSDSYRNLFVNWEGSLKKKKASFPALDVFTTE
jgi:hypothetical protein